MFSFFQKKKPLVTDLSWMGVDIHSHLLPSLDDGSPDVMTSVALIRRLSNIGLDTFHCTPHIFKELYPNTPQTINAALDQLRKALEEEKIDVKVTAAAEHMVDSDFTVEEGLMSLPDKHLLIEMSYLNETPNIEQVIFDLQIQGYTVVLAHPERYNFYHQNFPRYRRLKDMGCLFQLNLLAITGYYGKPVKQVAEQLLASKLYDLVGTDLHHEKHLQALEYAVHQGILFQKVGHFPFLNQQLFGKYN